MATTLISQRLHLSLFTVISFCFVILLNVFHWFSFIKTFSGGFAVSEKRNLIRYGPIWEKKKDLASSPFRLLRIGTNYATSSL